MDDAKLPAQRSPREQLQSRYPDAAPRWIGGRAHTLLGHYWTRDDPEDVRDALIADWIEILSDPPLPQEAIEHAAKMYLRNQPRKRPTPGEIRAMAETWVYARLKAQRASLPPPPEPERPPRVTPEQIEQIYREKVWDPRKRLAETIIKRMPGVPARDPAEARPLPETLKLVRRQREGKG